MEPKIELIIDALVGYSFVGEPYGNVARLIDLVNYAKASGVPILSLDVPSGMDATTGEIHQPCINASATMTLALPKTGLMKNNAMDIVGFLFLVDISVPPDLYSQIGLEIRNLFPEKEIFKLF